MKLFTINESTIVQLYGISEMIILRGEMVAANNVY